MVIVCVTITRDAGRSGLPHTAPAEEINSIGTWLGKTENSKQRRRMRQLIDQPKLRMFCIQVPISDMSCPR